MTQAPAKAVRADGWTPDRQRSFLAAIAEGQTVERACRIVGLSVASAYALRRRASGATFALGWQAASLLARDAIADGLTTRALDGQVETVTRPDGTTIVRHRFDNRFAMQMLSRLDRLADAEAGRDTFGPARLVAQDWEAYLDLVERDAGPARAGLFLTGRASAATADGDFAPIAALARADRWLRTRTALDGDLAIEDLDPDRRGDWTAEQWARAEAAGLLVLAPAPADVEDGAAPQLPQLHDDDNDIAPEDRPEPVWWCATLQQWRTRFPHPYGDGDDEDGEFGDLGYSRALDREELDLVLAPHRADTADRLVEEERVRAAWFVAAAGDHAPKPAPVAVAPIFADTCDDPEDAIDDASDDPDEDWDYADDDLPPAPEAAWAGSAAPTSPRILIT
jgi:hypothetical protein